MAKSDTTDLRRLVVDDFVTYLREGTINADQVARSYDYPGVRIDDFDRLMGLHFVLHEEVVDYVSKLQRRIRRTKVEQQRVKETYRGEIRGPIDWPQTISRRLATGYDDQTLFVVEDPTVEFDIPENRVVKKLLGTIEKTVSSTVEGADYGWAQNWSDDLIVELQRILANNVYLAALPETGSIAITDRAITKARRSRHDLYSEAARLFLILRGLREARFERGEVRSFLRDTIISPTEDFRIFEFFCVFGLIRRLKERIGGLELKPIDSEGDPVAVLLGDGRTVQIYHDVGEPLTFFEEYPPSAELEEKNVPEALVRHARALEEYRDNLSGLLDRDARKNFYGGRPDFLVLDWNGAPTSGEIREVLIGEIKYTQFSETFSTGLRELHEYLQLAKYGDDWLLDGKVPRSAVRGVICSDGVDTSMKRGDVVEHWTTDDIMSVFEETDRDGE